MNAQIGPAHASQKSEILELLAVQMREHAIAISLPEMTRAVDGILSDPALGALFTAVVGGRVVGVACLAYIWTIEHGGKSAWLEELYVRPEHRSGGVGQALLDAALSHARDAGCHGVDLEVDVDHARAENLYRRNGFVRHSRARWYRLFS